MDNFEKHIRENVTQFDDHKVDNEGLWAKIATQLKDEDSQKSKVVLLRNFPLLKIAASIVLALGMALIISLALRTSTATETQYASKELLDIDMHYQALVSYQVQLVKDNPNLSDDDKIEFLSFMDELDTEYELLRMEMRKNLDNEVVLEAIVANYKQRIELIEQLLKQINDSKLTDEDYGYTL